MDSPTLTLDDPQIGHKGQPGQKETHHLHIANEIATLTCTATRYDQENRAYIYIRGLQFTKACLALLTFSTGNGGTVMYEKTIEPDGSEQSLFFFAPNVKDYCRSFSIPQHFNEMLSFGVKHPELIYAIIDVTQSISDPEGFAFKGARAVERIRALVAGPGIKPDDAWQMLQEALRVDKAYLKFITDHSRAPRHGHDFTHTRDINLTVIERCWTIIDRSIEYVRRNRQPLPAEEFPLLTG